MCVALCLLLTGCGGAQYSLDFPFSPGQSWVMANAQGDLTFFDTTSVQNVGCERAKKLISTLQRCRRDLLGTRAHPC